MKKELQQDLQEVAKAILREGDGMDIVVLKQKVATLYEKLSVLAYLEGDAPDSVNKEESFDSKSFREQHWFTEPEPIPQPEHKEDLVEPLMEKIKDLVAQMPPEAQEVDRILEEVLPQKKFVKNDLEEFAKNYQQTPTFERKVVEAPKEEKPTLEERQPAKGMDVPKQGKRLVDDLGLSEKPKSINDSVGEGIRIDLNDRLAYIKHLFGGSEEDYTRVMSQLSTFSTLKEAEFFIKTKVKPEYNHWLQKDLYATRFMKAIERKFN
ncbi:MAG: hypothetical protein R3359_02505 [Marinirhabdus sp.]|nr:hypothetical protein [Marinirhabdus sp.]